MTIREPKRYLFDAETNPIVIRIVQIIRDQHVQTDISLKTIAAQMYFSPTYLAGLFKQKTGESIGGYITKLRIQEAKDLLWDQNLRVYQVAKMVGFADAKYFSKIFKRNTGLTPSAYRKIVG